MFVKKLLKEILYLHNHFIMKMIKQKKFDFFKKLKIFINFNTNNNNLKMLWDVYKILF